MVAEYNPVRDVDLEPFADLDKTAVRGKRVPWQRRVDLIFKQFPSTKAIHSGTEVPNWRKAFDKDLDLFAWILRDVLKADGATPGRSGPKPTVNRAAAEARLRQLMGNDYTVEPFHVAFSTLAGNRSLSNLAYKTGISRSQVNRLLKGLCEPTGYEMEQVARGFSLPPGYFTEYRLGVVVAAIVDKLKQYPDATVKYWREIATSELING